MKGTKFLFRRVFTDLSFGVAYLLIYIVLFSQMGMNDAVMYTTNMLILLFPLASFVNLGGAYMNLALGFGSTRREYFVITLMLKLVVAALCYGFTVLLGMIVGQAVPVSLASFLWFTCVAYVLCTLGQIFGMLMARVGKAMVWIYAGIMGVFGAAAGVYGAMSGGNVIMVQGLIGLISNSSVLAGLLLVGMAGFTVLLYYMSRKAVVK